MVIDPNSLIVNVMVTVMMIVMIFVLPAVDRGLCRRYGINLYGGPSENPDADRLLRLRKVLLCLMFAVYLAAFLYVTLFSRTAAADYIIHTALYDDLKSSFRIDLGFLDFFRVFFREGFAAAVSHVKIVRTANITQVYMNIALMVPMGYLLPYIFRWFRDRVRIRPVAACLAASFLIENIQLVTKRGFYDVDDLVSNTLGGFVGQTMYIAVAYVLTHPGWRQEIRRYRRWRRIARRSALFPFLRKISVSRATIYATDESAVWDFYIRKLGFRLRRQLVPEDASTSFLLEAASTQIEIICLNREEELPDQYLTLSCRNLDKVRKRLTKLGIDEGNYEVDPYLGVRTLRFPGPDNVEIILLEE